MNIRPFVETEGGHLLASLVADGELTIVVPIHEPRCSASIKLQAAGGNAEPRVDVLGTPLTVDVSYKLLPGSTVHVFAWSTATIWIEGSKQLLKNVFKSSTRSLTRPLVEYHCLMHPLRAKAETSHTAGPIIIVCGGASSGCSVIGRSLCSYAARSGWKPTFVDLDCGATQSIGIPGSIGAAIVEYPICVDEVISLSHVSTTYFVGATDPQKVGPDGEGSMLASYSHYTHLLLSCVQGRLARHVGNLYGASGAIVVLPELRGNAGVNFVADIINRYDVSNVLCTGDDYMFHKLYQKFSMAQQDESASKTRIDRISQMYCTLPAYPSEAMLPYKFEEYFGGSGAINLYQARWSKTLENLDIYQLKDENDQVVLSGVKGEELKGIVGCVGALFPVSKTGSALLQTPLAYVRVQSIEASGVFFITTTHYTFPSEKMCLIVGSVRWITSLNS